MRRLEKQYITIKYIEYVRIYEAFTRSPNYYMDNDEHQWKAEVENIRTLPIRIEGDNHWHHTHFYNLLTDMFDLPHEDKINMFKRFYAETYENVAFLDFIPSLKTIKHVINTLEKLILDKIEIEDEPTQTETI